MVSVSRPSAFMFLFLLIPAGLYMILRFRKLIALLGGMYGKKDAYNVTAFHRLYRSFAFKIVFRGLAFVFLVLAYAGISWGEKMVPVQKNGNAVCLVFDISYSMNARDAGHGLTRLEAARQYAEALLNAMKNPSVSIVLAKGDGILALPLTEDRSAMQMLLESLSPTLMTASGSSIGRGIQAALNAFPHNSAQAARVWVFTDGDETDNALQAALDDAVRYGIPVALIGFGSESGAEVLAGDGKTKVRTALKAEKLSAASSRANEKNVLPQRKSQHGLVQYVPAMEHGSAYQLLRSVSSTDTTYSYEVQKVDRHGIFLLLAILSFIASFVFGEADILSLRHASVAFLVAAPILFTSCHVSDSTAVLKGVWAWYQKNYQQATALFLQTFNSAQAQQDSDLEQYALFGLSATYLAQEEYDAALARLNQIAPDASPQLRSIALYNEGIIAHHNGDNAKAVECFKASILADGMNTNAKINLELCQTEDSVHQGQGAEKEMQQASETKDETALEKGVFTLIKENEQNQWKKMQSNKQESNALDY